MMFSIKKFLPRTLYGRSLLIIAVPILLIQVLMAYVFYDRHWSKMTDRLSFAVAGEIAIISERFDAHYDKDAFAKMASDVVQSLELLISYEEGAQLDNSEPQSRSLRSSYVARTLTRSMDNKVRRPYVISVSEQDKWVAVTVELSHGLLHISMPERRLFSSSSYIFLLWMLGISLILLAVAVIFMRNQIRPIRKLAVAAERLGKGQDIPLSFKPEGAREVRQAADAFIKMHERIKRQMQQRTAMLAGVSHDLRTPLTRMKLQLEMLGEGQDIKDLKTDITDMERMVDAYLDFVRGEGQEKQKLSDMKQLLQRSIEKARRQDAQIEENIESVSLMLKPLAFERCMDNLIGNARQYGEKIWVSTHISENDLTIMVEDDGPGIAEEKYEEVFRPFFRIDSSRNLAKGGVGLGLPIVQDIVHSHGGEIVLGKSKHGGLSVEVTLPL
jgi:two-component system osmolarity sensor histidine kinase EnvZ